MGLKHLILYEDNHLLIINKPSGWLSQGDQTGDKSILDIFKDYLKTRKRKEGNVFLGLPHRLDRPVSGCIILCKTSKSLTRMTQLIKDRKLKKIYHAVIKDRVYREPATLRSFIKKDTRRNRAIISDKEFKFSKSAILHFEVLQIIDQFSLL
ncbi:MAG: RNA pseudouridine synthase, partial [Bacteroidia bacterium]|nr:RNA pseudouridine synthase [Bacteroidia bacterium]